MKTPTQTTTDEQTRIEVATAAIRIALTGPCPLFWFNDIVDVYGERIAHLARIAATTTPA